MTTDRALSIIRNRRKHFVMQLVRQLRNLRDFLRQKIAHQHRPPAVPNGGLTVFDDNIEERIRAVHQLEVWRAARRAAISQNSNCPTRPRFLKGLLTPAEEEHVLSCKDCQETKGSIRWFALRRNLQRLDVWRVNQVQRVHAFVGRHKKASLFPLIAQLLVLLVGVYLVNATLSARSSTNMSELSAEASLDAARSIAAQSDEELLFQKIDSLQAEIVRLKKAQALQYLRAVQLQQISRMSGSGTGRTAPQEARFVLRCDAPDQRASNLWCLPSKEIERRQEAMVKFLRVYKEFAAKRESFTMKSRETVPRGKTQGFTPAPSGAVVGSFPPNASYVAASPYQGVPSQQR
jgi:hypothetical protein